MRPVPLLLALLLLARPAAAQQETAAAPQAPKTPAARPQASRLEPPRPALAVALEELARAPGLFLGEVHEDDHPSYRFALDNLEAFRSAGVRLLGFEMVNAVDQGAIDAYYADPEEGARALKDVLTRRWGSPYRFELVEKARALGIRTVAVDHRPEGHPHYSPAQINALWAAETREALRGLPDGSKFVVYGGFLHGLPGPDRVPAILGIPAILPANPNDYREDYFDWEERWLVVGSEGRVHSAARALSFSKECATEAGRRRDPSLADLTAAYAGLCETLRARGDGFDAAGRRVLEASGRVRALLPADADWDRRYLDELERRLGAN